jgi:hypothetical protein
MKENITSEVLYMAFLNAWWLYAVVGIIFVYILLQSSVFLMKAIKRAKVLEFTNDQIRKTITSSMVFSIAPSVAILIGLVTLSKIIGPALAAMRLGTLGAVTYELPTSLLVLESFGLNSGDMLNGNVVVTIIWVLTFGCIPPLLIIPFFYKKMSRTMKAVKEKDSNWNAILMDALFIGMISAFVGFVLAPRTVSGETYISLLAILVLLSSMALIVIFGLLLKKFKWEWLRNYALPLSMVIAMALAIVYAGLGVR